MTAVSASLRLLTVSLGRRPAAAGTGPSSAAIASRGTSSALLHGSQGCARLDRPDRQIAVLHGSRLVCSAAEDDVMEVQLKVAGMVCDGCSSRVEETLQKMAGVKMVQVDLDKGLATVQVEAGSQIDALNAVQPLAEAIRRLGFEAEPHFGGI